MGKLKYLQEIRVREAAEWRGVHELRKCAADAGRRADRAEKRIREYAEYEVEAWAESVLADEDTVVLALATTGIHGPIAPVEFLVLDNNREPLFHEHVRPYYEMDPKSSEMHGHTAESLQDAPEIEEVWTRLRETLENKRVVGYNLPWLAEVLADTARYKSLDPLDLSAAECVMEAYSRLRGTWYVSHEGYAGLPLPRRDDGTPKSNAVATLSLINSLYCGNAPDPRSNVSGGSGHDDREEQEWDDIPFRAFFPQRGLNLL